MRWKWFKIVKRAKNFPEGGGYKNWKRELAREGRYQCVYCTIHENSFGGTWNFHVEHYRPQSKFASLVNVFENLFYACAICNVFKGDDWPREPRGDYSLPCYPNPCEVDYCDLLDVDPESGLVASESVAGKYVIEKVYLNRPQLVLERRRSHILERMGLLSAELKGLVPKLECRDDRESRRLLSEVAQCLISISELQSRARQLRPYVADDVKRRAGK